MRTPQSYENIWHGVGQIEPPEVFYEEGVLRNMAKFTGKHLCQSLFVSFSGRYEKQAEP